MKRGLYLCKQNYNFDDINVHATGIAKKILSQLKVLNTNGLDTKLVNYNFTDVSYFRRLLSFFFTKRVYIKKISNIDFSGINFIYVRRFSPTDRNLLYLLAAIKKVNQNCRIIYEIPTYPYDEEHTGIKGSIVLFTDRLFRKCLYKYINYIATYSHHDEIFGVPTIKIVNGIDCSAIPLVTAKAYHDDIHLICVAQFSSWHGYDRLIDGLYAHYKNNPEKKIFIDFVGDGDALQQYRDMVSTYKLERYVIFHGILAGDDLSAVFNQADMAVCSLGCHRKGIILSSELKSREYMDRGLPMVASAKIDILTNDYVYVHYVPDDDSPIDIEAILSFYDMLKWREPRQKQIYNIRAFAENNCDMHITMRPILDKLYD